MAREKRDNARELLANGSDPSETRKAEKVAKSHTFESVARDWLASTAHTVNEQTQQKKVRKFECHVFPAIGNVAITDVKAPMIYSLIKPLITRNQLETAHRVRSEISAVFHYAIAHGMTENNPALSVSAQLPTKKVKHRAAITDLQHTGS